MNRVIDYALYTAVSATVATVLASTTIQEALVDMERPKKYLKPLPGYIGFLPPQTDKDYAYFKLAAHMPEKMDILQRIEYLKVYREQKTQMIIEHNKTLPY